MSGATTSNYGPVGGADLYTGGAVKAQSGELQRDGVMGGAAIRTERQVSTAVDLYYSEFRETTLSREFATPLFPNWFGTTLTNAPNRWRSGHRRHLRGSQGRAWQQPRRRDAELWAVGWNVEAMVSDNWTVTFDISHSAIDRTDHILQTNSGTGPVGQGALDSIGFSVGENSVPTFSAALDYADPGSSPHQPGRMGRQRRSRAAR